LQAVRFDFLVVFFLATFFFATFFLAMYGSFEEKRDRKELRTH
jgi:hypothetical protein